MIQLNQIIAKKPATGLNHFSMLVIASSLLFNLRLQNLN